MKPEPLKGKVPYGWVNNYGRNILAYEVEDVKSAIKYLRELIFKKDSISAEDWRYIQKSIDEAFEDVIEKEEK